MAQDALVHHRHACQGDEIPGDGLDQQEQDGLEDKQGDECPQKTSSQETCHLPILPAFPPGGSTFQSIT